MTISFSVFNGASGGPALSSLVSYACDRVNDATMEQGQDQPEEDKLDDIFAAVDELELDRTELEEELDQTP
jgi:hypothetical protein